MYTWYDMTDATDTAFFTGDYDYSTVSTATYAPTNTEISEVTGGL